MTMTRKPVAGAVLAAAMLGSLVAATASAQRDGVDSSARELEEISVGALKRLPALDVGPKRASSLEEVTVRGRRSMLAYRIEIEAARDRIYEVFNALNSDDEFDISCSYERPTGTRIPQRRCRPQFVKDATSEAARAYLDSILFGEGGAAGVAKAAAAKSVAQAKHVVLVDEMERLVTEHPELAEAFLEYFELQDDYREARAGRRD